LWVRMGNRYKIGGDAIHHPSEALQARAAG
jgi:hypothetical protein